MKTNTFYNPKNQFGELLASQPELEKAKKDLNGTIASEAADREKNDNEIRTSVANLNTIKVKWINADRGDNKFSEIEDYFISRLENASEEEIAELKIELGQTIYIIEGKDDASTYEEWICRYPNVEINSTHLPEMIRLGAVDSILAHVDKPGSVKLVHNLYDEEDWSKYFATDYEGNITNKPIKGEAVAPCALRAFVNADKDIIKNLDAEEAARAEEDAAIKARLDKIEAEIEGSPIEDAIGFQDSRLDKIETIIGMNHHHSGSCGCGHSHCPTSDSCSFDPEKDCNLICKINALDDAVNTNASSLIELNTAFYEFKDTTFTQFENDTVERLNFAEDNINTIYQTIGTTQQINDPSTIRGKITNLQEKDTLIDEKIDDILERVGANEINIGNKNSDIKTKDNLWGNIRQIESDINELDTECSKEIDNINTEIGNIKSEIGDKTSSDTNDTLWGSIKLNNGKIEDLKLSLGNKTDGNSSDSAWANINSLKSSLSEFDEKVNGFESRIETQEEFNKVRNVVIVAKIPSTEGESLEISYSKILENIFPDNNWSNYEIIVNGVKIEDVDNETGSKYTINAWPSITYIKDDTGTTEGAQFNKIKLDFGDNDSSDHNAYISITIYDVTSHKSYIHLL